MAYETYYTMAGATVVLLTAYIALLHMASRFLNRPEMAAYANVELQHLFMSVIIFGIALLMLMGFDAAGTAIAGEPPINASLSFLHKTINRGVIPAYIDLVSLDVKLSFWNSLYGRHGPTVWNFLAKQVAGLDPIISVVRVLTFTLTAFFGTLSAQVVIFYVIEALMVNFVLPAGVLLRFFPTTRDAGVYLIVFAISFQAVFPLLFTINAHILDEMWGAFYGTRYDPYTTLPAGLIGSEIPEYAPSWVADMVGDPSVSAQAVGFFPFVWFFRFYLLAPFFEGIASISLPALVLPALAMSLTISFINAFTKFLTGKG
ncbi:MAG: hypothetical protein AB1657_01210 [Candidatus Micrarchaeota archaeon]